MEDLSIVYSTSTAVLWREFNLSTINVYSCNARDETVRLCVFTALLK
jgi:hypothetical protein